MIMQRQVKAHLVATSSSAPGKYYGQEELADTICKFLDEKKLNFSSDTVRSLFKNVQVDGRYFSFPIENFNSPGNMESLAVEVIETCVDQAEFNVKKLFEESGLGPKDISQIVSVTLVPAVPTIEARLMNRIPFSNNLKRMPLAGLGCMAGAAAISRAADYLDGHPEEALIVISCEISSSLWQGSIQRDLQEMITNLDTNPSLHSEIVMSIVTAGLFGDGSGGVLMVGRDHPSASNSIFSILDNRSNWIPDTEHIMGLDVIDSGFRNILRNEVKSFVKVGVRQVLEPLLEQNQFATTDISNWIIHPGGPKIMDAVETAYQLSPKKMELSRNTLKNIGNVSSATIMHMLDHTVNNSRPNKDEDWFGSRHGARVFSRIDFDQLVVLWTTKYYLRLLLF